MTARLVQSASDGLPFPADADEGVAGTASSSSRLLTKRRVPELRVRELTAQQCAILRGLQRGDKRQMIAADLGVSLNSVRTQLRRSFLKLGVASSQDAVRHHKRLHGPRCARGGDLSPSKVAGG